MNIKNLQRKEIEYLAELVKEAWYFKRCEEKLSASEQCILYQRLQNVLLEREK